MSYEEQQQLEATYMMQTYARKPVQFVRGEGTRLYDSEGKDYLDFLAGIGAVCLGHANPAVAEAIAAQAKKLLHVGNYYYVEGRAELAQDLSQLLNAGQANARPWKTFFANSGAEANEGAIKLARKYGKLHLNGAGTILSAERSFHGRTLATTAATGQAVKQESFAPMPTGFAHFVPGDLDSLFNALANAARDSRQKGQNELAPVAVLLECVQGEGGVWPLSEEYLQSVRSMTGAQGILLIIDEVQSGFYRTGLPFAFQHADIQPDVVTMAKGIANGFPVAALAANGLAADILVPGEHGSTFGGNPLAIAAARATLAELHRRNLGTNATQVGAYLQAQLAALPHVLEVRGQGLMVGLTLDEDIATQVADAVLEQGAVINSIGSDILRFLPPLSISKKEVDELIAIIRGILEAR